MSGTLKLEENGEFAPSAARWKDPWHSGLAALATVLALVLAGRVFEIKNDQKLQAGSDLIARAAQIEQNSFRGAGIIHIIDLISLETYGNHALPQVLWLPQAQLDDKGTIQHGRLNIPEGQGLFASEIWFDPSSGRFRRVFKAGDETIYGFAFDGRSIHSVNMATGGRMLSRAVSPAFIFPEHPDELFGLTAGLPVSLSALMSGKAVPTGEEKLLMGRWACGFMIEMPGAGERPDKAWQLKLDLRDHSPAGLVCIERGIPLFSIYRARFEKSEKMPASWDLSDLPQT